MGRSRSALVGLIRLRCLPRSRAYLRGWEDCLGRKIGPLHSLLQPDQDSLNRVGGARDVRGVGVGLVFRWGSGCLTDRLERLFHELFLVLYGDYAHSLRNQGSIDNLEHVLLITALKQAAHRRHDSYHRSLRVPGDSDLHAPFSTHRKCLRRRGDSFVCSSDTLANIRELKGGGLVRFRTRRV